MPVKTARIVGMVGVVLVMSLVGTGAATFRYRQQAATLQQRLAAAERAVEDLEREVRQRQRPTAAIMRLDYAPVGPAGEEPTGFTLETDDETEQLRARLAAMEAALRARETPVTVRAPTEDGSNNWRSRFSPEALAEWQRTDPERYAEYMQRREAARRAADEAISRQATLLLETDASTWSRDEQAERAVMLQMVSDTWKMAGDLMAVPPPENRREIMRAVHENLAELGPMFEAERDRQFRQLALESGYDARDAALFVEYLNDVIYATSTSPFRRGMRRGGGSGGGPPPPTTPR